MPFANTNHSFDIGLAAKFGVEEAILIHHFQLWIRFNKNLKRNQFKGKTWSYQTYREIAAHFPYLSPDKVRYAIQNLEKKNILIKGNFNKKKSDQTIWYSFVDEKKYLPEIHEKSEQENPSEPEEKTKNEEGGSGNFPRGSGNFPRGSGNFPKSLPCPIPCPIPSLEEGIAPLPPIVHNSSESGNEALDKALPFHKNEKKDEEKGSSKRKFPRKPEKEKIFQWLMSLKLNTDEDTLSFWANKFDEKKLHDAWEHFQYRKKCGRSIDNPGGLYFKFIMEENSPITNKCLENKKQADDFMKSTGWNGLILKERYCIDENRTDYDLSYNIGHLEFYEKLISMWELKTGRSYEGQNQTLVGKHEEQYQECCQSY